MTNNNSDNFKPVHWTEIHGNPFNRNPSAEMLQGKGQTIFVNCWLIGQSRINPMEIRAVFYDRDYVVQYFAQRVKRLNLLRCEWTELTEEIYDFTVANAESSVHEET